MHRANSRAGGSPDGRVQPIYYTAPPRSEHTNTPDRDPPHSSPPSLSFSLFSSSRSRSPRRCTTSSARVERRHQARTSSARWERRRVAPGQASRKEQRWPLRPSPLRPIARRPWTSPWWAAGPQASSWRNAWWRPDSPGVRSTPSPTLVWPWASASTLCSHRLSPSSG
jgi:hypothetical protein